MEMVYYTIVAVLLYMGSDWILNRIEVARGARFPHRSLVFLVIITVLAVSSFSLISALYKPIEQPSTETTETAPKFESSAIPE